MTAPDPIEAAIPASDPGFGMLIVSIGGITWAVELDCSTSTPEPTVKLAMKLEEAEITAFDSNYISDRTMCFAAEMSGRLKSGVRYVLNRPPDADKIRDVVQFGGGPKEAERTADREPVEAAIEVAINHVAADETLPRLCDDWDEIVAAAIRAAAPGLIAHGRELAADAAEPYCARAGAFCVQIARGEQS